jgi:hypothetical protein
MVLCLALLSYGWAIRFTRRVSYGGSREQPSEQPGQAYRERPRLLPAETRTWGGLADAAGATGTLATLESGQEVSR